MEQRVSRILYSVFKIVNNKTIPYSLNELISLRETTYALRGKDSLKVQKLGQRNALWTQFLAVSGAQDLEQLA